MAIYSIKIKIYATVYIRARSQKEALAIAKGMKNDTMELAMDEDSELPICGRSYDDPDLPDLSLSPAMTIHGPDAGGQPTRVA